MEHLIALASTPMTVLASAFIAMNLLAFAQFGIDKARAVRGDWRIAESTLLMTAFFGGYLGAKAGQARFRHKTRKQPFAKHLNHVGLAGMVVIAVLTVPTSREAVFEVAGTFLSLIGNETAQTAQRPPRVLRM